VSRGCWSVSMSLGFQNYLICAVRTFSNFRMFQAERNQWQRKPTSLLHRRYKQLHVVRQCPLATLAGCSRPASSSVKHQPHPYYKGSDPLYAQVHESKLFQVFDRTMQHNWSLCCKSLHFARIGQVSDCDDLSILSRRLLSDVISDTNVVSKNNWNKPE
jgi:hypothetical protein